MNRIDRLTAILIQLQTKRVVRGREIATRFGISLRTVYRDIRSLEDAGVPIGSESGLGYFLAEGYHLPPVMFTTQEARALFMGGKLVEKFSDPSVHLSFDMALDKIKSILEKSDQDHLDTLSDYMQVLKSAPAQARSFPNDLLQKIQSVMGRNRLIRISYKSGYKGEVTRRDIEPLGLCFYGGHWHLLAYCRLRGEYRDFRVDRIRSLTTLDSPFDRVRHGTFRDLIDRIVFSADLKPACLRFSKGAARHIRDQKYYFGFVEEKTVGARVEMQFLTVSYDYFSHWLLSFVDQVEIVSPDSLKEILREHVRRLAAHHLGWKRPFPDEH